MAMRRPRIKASANLMTSKRKPKLQPNSSSPTLVDNESMNSDKKTENEEATPEEDNSLVEKVRESVDTSSKHEEIETSIKADGIETSKEPTVDKYVTNVITGSVDVAPDQEETNEKNTIVTAPEKLFNPKLNQTDVKVTQNEENTTDTVPKKLLNPKFDQTDIKILQNEENNHQQAINAVEEKVEDKSFKCPTNVISFNRSNSNTATSVLTNAAGIGSSDDVYHSDLEDVNVIQMDMQKSSNSNSNINACPLSPMSPSKPISRQRIRPMPIFGQRRNSFVASSPSPHTGDDGAPDFQAPILHRRERHYSASLSQTSNTSSTHAVHYHTPHKYVPLMHTGRIRTESGCSAFSDTSKSRKTDDHHQHHRTLSRRDFEARFSKGVVPDKSSLKMFDLIYYNPATNPMEQKPNVLNMKQESTQPNDAKKSEDAKPASNIDDKTTTDAPAASMPVPQLKLNSNGELILDDKSLVIETTAEQEARKALANSTLIFLDENTGMNGFYRKKKRTKEWQPDETIKFYRCLQTVGTDFSLMCQLFPKRTRRDLKLKFKKEERCNLALINKAILYPKIFNIDELKEQLETEERERAEVEQRWKELKARESEFKKVKTKNYSKLSSGARTLVDGDLIYHLSLNDDTTKDKPKKRRIKKNINKVTKKQSKKEQKDDSAVSATMEEHITPSADEMPPMKKKRSRPPKKPKILSGQQKKQIKIENICIFASGDNFTHENIKEENQQQQQNCEIAAQAAYETNQLEMELDDLLHNNQQADEMNTDSYNNNTDGNIQYILESPNEVAHNEDGIECKSLVNLDDGTVTLVNDNAYLISSPYHVVTDDFAISLVEEEQHEEQQWKEEDKLEQQDLDESPKYNKSDMNESDIQQILTELSEGSMVLVSTLDPNNPDKLLNEIYMLDKITGELCDTPLDIPDTIVQCILSVMS